MQSRKRICKDISNDEYIYIHSYLRVKYGRAYKCENPLCEMRSPSFSWALIRGKKYELKENNFVQLCQRCHSEYDKRWRPSELTAKYHESVKKAISGCAFADRFYARPIFKTSK